MSFQTFKSNFCTDRAFKIFDWFQTPQIEDGLWSSFTLFSDEKREEIWILLPCLFEKEVTSCFCGWKFCVRRRAKRKKVEKQGKMLPQQMAPSTPTTSEKKKRLSISCLNFVKTRVKKCVKMPWTFWQQIIQIWPKISWKLERHICVFPPQQ